MGSADGQCLMGLFAVYQDACWGDQQGVLSECFKHHFQVPGMVQRGSF